MESSVNGDKVYPTHITPTSHKRADARGGTRGDGHCVGQRIISPLVGRVRLLNWKKTCLHYTATRNKNPDENDLDFRGKKQCPQKHDSAIFSPKVLWWDYKHTKAKATTTIFSVLPQKVPRLSNDTHTQVTSFLFVSYPIHTYIHTYSKSLFNHECCHCHHSPHARGSTEKDD